MTEVCMDLAFQKTPVLFGPVHLFILASVLVVSVLLFFVLSKCPRAALRNVIFVTGLCMLMAEVLKQWFVFRYVFPGQRSAWFFPWQLCSMAMYLGALLPLLKGKAEQAALVFLSTYSLLAAAAALILPLDMLRPQVLLFLHGFLYHAGMIVMGLAAFLLLKDRPSVIFRPALLLFLAMAAVAEIINVISHALIRNPALEANMFYITPYYPSTQPVIHEIAVTFGILPSVLIYLAVISLASFGLFLFERSFRKRSGTLSSAG